MPMHHDRRRDAVQRAKEPRPKGGRQIARFGASGALTGAKARCRAPSYRNRLFADHSSPPFMSP
jgi:hypothetical protein